ncbi:uncharacterized protein LOC123498539 isoform X2 [Portunus trituberculatus]|uniref:uncharacterized protein LOC123498539 isoform X2 n=1 Tax=Portunus trituberculatus TaxID=210409 RepID=UPI001E1CC077|nr:uncharacterized protein LOC123498539 isoform X2 [Portunus trituberculatus]
MERLLAPLILLLATTTLPGLGAEHQLESCGDGGGSLIDHVLCDPNHLVQPVNRQVFIEVLTRCGEDTGLRLLVFLAATLPHDTGDVEASTTPVTTTIMSTKQSSGDGSMGSRGITHLKERVVAANNLTTTSSPVILLVGVKDQLKMATWWSDSLSGVLTTSTIQEAQKNASNFMDQQLFIDAIVHVACYLCQSVRGGGNSWSVQQIVLTATWIAFTVSFVVLLLAIAVILIKGRIDAQKYRAEKSKAEAGQRASIVTFARASDTHDWSRASFKSTGHVLLGTTDIKAVPPHDCTSTDNLLENC